MGQRALPDLITVGNSGLTATYFAGKPVSDLNLDLRENSNSANRGKNRGKSWEKPWENDLNFFPLSSFPRTRVRIVNSIVLERGTGFEPATSTLGTRRQPSAIVNGHPHVGVYKVERSSGVHIHPWENRGKLGKSCGRSIHGKSFISPEGASVANA